MAAASVLTHPQAIGTGLEHQHYAPSFPDFNTLAAVPAAPSPRAQAFPTYDSSGPLRGDTRAYGYPFSSGAVAAAQAASGYGKTTGRPNETAKRRSWSRTRTPPPPPASSVDSIKSPAARATAAKEKFKINLKKVAQQKADQLTTLDLSKTAEENERRTGIPIYSQGRAARSATDVHFTHQSRRRNNTFGYGAEYNSFKPSTPFVPIPPGDHTESPRITHRSYANSTVNSEYSADRHDVSSRPSGLGSRRPSLHINTSTDATSIPSVSTRGRRNTNQSSASANTPGSKPRKSLDKALSIMTRRDSSATDDMMDPATRVASIQAARQAFEERQEKKDAKYEKRAAKDRQRQEKKDSRASSAGQRVRGNSSAPKNGSTLHISEKVDDSVEGTAYDELPVPLPSSRPSTGPKLASERITFSRKRHAKNRYAWWLSWLKTRFLNVGRRRRKA